MNYPSIILFLRLICNKYQFKDYDYFWSQALDLKQEPQTDFSLSLRIIHK